MLKVDKTLCFYCGTCVGVCPQGSIELSDVGEVDIDESCVEHRCMKWNCRICVKSCPVGAIYGL